MQRRAATTRLLRCRHLVGVVSTEFQATLDSDIPVCPLSHTLFVLISSSSERGKLCPMSLIDSLGATPQSERLTIS